MKEQLHFQRRQFLQLSTKGMGAFFLGAQVQGLFAATESWPKGIFTQFTDFSALQPADENGIRLPKGFTSRIVARSSQQVISGSDYIWHGAPDGGACFATTDGGWVYVSNSEIKGNKGGVGCIRFNAHGEVVDAYPILEGTNNNCAGGRTPWNTWLSCEEVDRGRVFECDPYGQFPAVERSALGYFKHEAVTVDSFHEHLYLTEDEEDGNFYRFIPDNKLPDLESGVLQVAELVLRGDSAHETPIFDVVWHNVPDPQASKKATRKQVKQASKFNGSEGIEWNNHHVYFTTKGDNRVWDYDTRKKKITILYDIKTAKNPVLSGVDNLTITATGDVLVAEDGGDMQLVLLTVSGNVIPVMQVVGQDNSEICGPAFSPDYQRLYFSSQTGPNDRDEEGIIYEIRRI